MDFRNGGDAALRRPIGAARRLDRELEMTSGKLYNVGHEKDRIYEVRSKRQED